MPSVFQAVKELLDMYLANPQVDKSRIYIMGLSMGAMGTYDMVSRFPDILQLPFLFVEQLIRRVCLLPEM